MPKSLENWFAYVLAPPGYGLRLSAYGLHDLQPTAYDREPTADGLRPTPRYARKKARFPYGQPATWCAGGLVSAPSELERPRVGPSPALPTRGRHRAEKFVLLLIIRYSVGSRAPLAPPSPGPSLRSGRVPLVAGCFRGCPRRPSRPPPSARAKRKKRAPVGRFRSRRAYGHAPGSPLTGARARRVSAPRRPDARQFYCGAPTGYLRIYSAVRAHVCAHTQGGPTHHPKFA